MTASHVTTRSTAERIRPWVVLIALPVTLAAAALGSGAFGGQEVQSSSSGALSADATPLAPASTAFSIWSVIYLGLAAYAIWQVLPKQRNDPRQRSISWLATASLVLNATWILCAQAGLLPLTVVVIVLLLGVLAAIFALLRRTEPRSTLEALLVDGTFGLYLGWVSVATVANIAAALAAAGWRPEPFEPLAIVVLAAVAAVGVAIALRGRGTIAPTLAILWGLSWIGIGRLYDQPASATVALAAAIACVVIGAATVIARLRRVPTQSAPVTDESRTPVSTS